MLGRGLCEGDTETQALGTTVSRRFVKPLNQLASVRFDHALRCNVVGVSGYLHVREPLTSGPRQQQLQGVSGISSPTLPWDHGISNMSQAIWRKICCTRFPAKTNRSTEFPVPHPPRVSRQTRNRATVRQNNLGPFGFSVYLLRKEASGILCNALEFLACSLGPQIVRRPASQKRMNIPGQVLRGRPNQFH